MLRFVGTLISLTRFNGDAEWRFQMTRQLYPGSLIRERFDAIMARLTPLQLDETSGGSSGDDMT